MDILPGEKRLPYLVLPLNVEKIDDTVAYRAERDSAITRAKGMSEADGMTWGVYFEVEVGKWELSGIAYHGQFFGETD